MLTLLYSKMLLKICNHSFRRYSSCWRLVMAARSEFRVCESPAIRRYFSRSSQSAESTDDALPEELSKMRSGMRDLHNIVSSKGDTLRDYKRISSEDEEQDVSSSAFRKDDSECDQFEDSSSEVKSPLESVGKRLRKQKDVDVLINTPYGHVRFDSVNRQRSAVRPVSEESAVVPDDVPSVKIVKDGRHVFSVNAMEEDASEDVASGKTCHATTSSQTETRNVKPNTFDEQYSGDVLQQEEEKQRNVANDTVSDSKMRDPKPDIFDDHFGNVTQLDAQKQTVRQQEEENLRDMAEDGETCDLKSNMFDQQCFGDVIQHEGQKQAYVSCSKMAKRALKMSEKYDTKPNVFDEQYFGDVLQQDEKQQSSQSTSRDHVEGTDNWKKLDDIANSASRTEAANISDEQMSMIDEQYFGSYAQSEVASLQAQEGDAITGVLSSAEQMSHFQQDHSLTSDIDTSFHQLSHMTLRESAVAHDCDSAPLWKEVEDILKDSVAEDDSPVVIEPITRREMKYRTRPSADVESPKTAYDLSVKIRHEKRQKQSEEQGQEQSTDKKQRQQPSGMKPNPNTRFLHNQFV